MAHWVDQIAEKQIHGKSVAEARLQANAASSLRVQARILEYWHQLVLELKEAERKLQENAGLHIAASVSVHVDPEFENKLRINITQMGFRPEITYTDVFHLIGQQFIRCHTLHGDTFRLPFGERGDGAIGLYSEDGRGVMMTPERAAHYIVEPMIKRVRGE
ncbi:hypothetical protein [Edaphobacter bradus]|uniref:hypothetical protein n=1 Tax=Edaphobacter bradus TaxID=2259016 RepID=UPI0021DF42EB|nr:hypothetical protein [Edaphobacter bradus]